MSDPEFIGPTLDIPAFLIISPEQRKKNWEGRSLTDPYRGGNRDERLLREREMLARIEAERRAKRDASREKFLAAKADAGEVYDRKLKVWVKAHRAPTGTD